MFFACFCGTKQVYRVKYFEEQKKLIKHINAALEIASVAALCITNPISQKLL